MILFHQAMIPPLKEQRQQCEKTFSHDAHFVLSERELTEEDELTICFGGGAASPLWWEEEEEMNRRSDTHQVMWSLLASQCGFCEPAHRFMQY